MRGVAMLCAIVGHKWFWKGRAATYRCERCGHYDDEPGIVRAAGRRAAFKRWSPVVLSIKKRETTLRVGVPWHPRVPRLSVRIDVHYGWERLGEGPGVMVSLDVWRLDVGVSVGGFWPGEESSDRALFRLWSSFNTEGWRYLGCWFGHQPEEWAPGCVSCDRCDASLAYVSPGERSVTAEP